MNQPRIHIRWYALGDLIATTLSWIAFYFLRELILYQNLAVGKKFYIGLIAFPLAWLTLYHLTGAYNNIYHKSRLTEFSNTIAVSFVGSIVILFLFLVYDAIGDYNIYYKEFLTLWGVLVFFTFSIRLVLLGIARGQLNRGAVFFNTLILGSSNNAAALYAAVKNNKDETVLPLALAKPMIR